MRKFLFSLIIISIILFFLLLAIFGENGIIQKEHIRKQIIQNEELFEKKDQVIKELEEKVDTLDTTQHIVNVMNDIGYAPSGQSSYIFPYSQHIRNQSEKITPQKENVPILSPYIILMISITFSIALHVVIFIFIHKRNKRKHKESNKNIDSPDNTYTIY